jgi:hypothetical protein
VERLLETPGSAVATTSNSNNITAEPSSNIIRQTTIEEPLASKTADNSADKAIDSSTGRLVDNSVLKEESQDEIFLPASTTDETLAQLIGMGYDLDAAQLALQQSAGNSLDEAIAFLFNQQKLVEGKPLSPASAVSSRPLLPPRSSPPPLPRRPSGSDQDGFPDLELDLEEAKRKLDSAVHSAGQFLQRVKTGIVTAVESIDSPSDREHTLGSSVLSEPSSPVSQFSVPDPLVTSPSQALPDKRFTIQEFRVSMKSGPQYSPKDLLKLYLRDCGKRQVEPISALIEQMEVSVRQL